MQALRIFDELGQLDHPGADKIRAKLQPPGAQAAGRQPDLTQRIRMPLSAQPVDRP